MKFGNTLKLHQKTDWSSDYIDYETLKKLIKKNIKEKTQFDYIEFYKLLEIEYQKITSFYKIKEEEMIQTMVTFEEKSKNIIDNIKFQQSLFLFNEKISTILGFCFLVKKKIMFN
jgi:SPX domain protein involved in polyphosphate accumulation